MSVSGYGFDDDTMRSGADAGLGGSLLGHRRNTWSIEQDIDRVSKNIYVPRVLCRIYDHMALTPDVVVRMVLLENYCLYLTTEYILYIKRFGDEMAKIVLGNVLDVCNIVGVSTDEYIVINLDGTVIFSIVQANRSSSDARRKNSRSNDDMVIQNTVIHKLPYFDNDAYIARTAVLCDKDKEVMCVISPHTIYILTVDFQTLYSGNDSLLGIVSFPSPLTYSKIELPVLNDIRLESPPRDEVYNCSIWSTAQHHSLVCSGNGAWLDIWPMNKIDDVWELKRSNYDPIRVNTGISLIDHVTHASTDLLAH